eukprot:evm.model.scf_1534.3 EVM.evm.TU.scf_1534.3   scf_1534:8688-15147(-)
MTCTMHALTTESEEVMGLLLGDITPGPNGTRTSRVWHAIPQIRTDRRKDRVEPSHEQLSECIAAAENLTRTTSQRTRVVGWYHSHPHITVHPSHVDLRTQADHQTLDEGFVGLIFSCFNSDQRLQCTAFQSTPVDQFSEDSASNAVDHEDPDMKRALQLSLSQGLPDTPKATNFKCKEVPVEVVQPKGVWECSARDSVRIQKILYHEERKAFHSAMEAKGGTVAKSLLSPCQSLHHSSVYIESLCRLMDSVVLPALHALETRVARNRVLCDHLDHQLAVHKRPPQPPLDAAKQQYDKLLMGNSVPPLASGSPSAGESEADRLIGMGRRANTEADAQGAVQEGTGNSAVGGRNPANSNSSVTTHPVFGSEIYRPVPIPAVTQQHEAAARPAWSPTESATGSPSQEWSGCLPQVVPPELAADRGHASQDLGMGLVGSPGSSQGITQAESRLFPGRGFEKNVSNVSSNGSAEVCGQQEATPSQAVGDGGCLVLAPATPPSANGLAGVQEMPPATQIEQVTVHGPAQGYNRSGAPHMGREVGEEPAAPVKATGEPMASAKGNWVEAAKRGNLAASPAAPVPHAKVPEVDRILPAEHARDGGHGFQGGDKGKDRQQGWGPASGIHESQHRGRQRGWGEGQGYRDNDSHVGRYKGARHGGRGGRGGRDGRDGRDGHRGGRGEMHNQGGRMKGFNRNHNQHQQHGYGEEDDEHGVAEWRDGGLAGVSRGEQWEESDGWQSQGKHPRGEQQDGARARRGSGNPGHRGESGNSAGQQRGGPRTPNRYPQHIREGANHGGKQGGYSRSQSFPQGREPGEYPDGPRGHGGRSGSRGGRPRGNVFRSHSRAGSNEQDGGHREGGYQGGRHD